MELTTILKRCHHFRGFVYEHARFSTDKKRIEVVLRPRKASTATSAVRRPTDTTNSPRGQAILAGSFQARRL
jgi:hypothetical protein